MDFESAQSVRARLRKAGITGKYNVRYEDFGSTGCTPAFVVTIKAADGAVVMSSSRGGYYTKDTAAKAEYDKAATALQGSNTLVTIG